MFQLLLSFLAGVLTIAAPCILLPLPILLGTSVGQTSKSRPLFIAIGFTFTFSVLALALHYIVNLFGISANLIRNLGSLVLAIFAFFMLWPKPFEILMVHMNGLINRAAQTSTKYGSGNWGGLVTGIVIGAVWAPCAGPILGSILTLIALQQETLKATLLLLAYSLGAGLPMLLIAYGSQKLTTQIRFIARYSHRIQQIFGLLLLVLSISIFLKYDTKLQSAILDKLPNFGSNVEQNILKNLNNTDNPSSNNPTTNQNLLTILPKIEGISNWHNSEPLTLEELRGKVVLVDFWTYSCINCIRTLPYITKWYDTYKDQGFVVIGVHTPEFEFEKDSKNVANAIGMFNIHYPIAQDNNYQTWQNFNNHYWPAHYLINKEGQIVDFHYGEGAYAETEEKIRELLKLPYTEIREIPETTIKTKTPEIYFGTDRLQYLSKEQGSRISTFSFPNELSLNHFALEGNWTFNSESVRLTKGPGKIRLKFFAAKVHLVATSPTPQKIQVTLDGKTQPEVVISSPMLNTLYSSDKYSEHILEITIPESGFEAFTFTFG